MPEQGLPVTIAIFPRDMTVYSKTFYFTDRFKQRGFTYEIFNLFEQDLNEKLTKKLAKKHLKVQVFCIPVRRDELLPALVGGKGDIAASNLTITPQREKLVDFSAPGYTNVSEVVVSGLPSPRLSSVDDLAGKEVFVRKSSSYYESLVALNQRFAEKKQPPVKITLAPEELEDEDLVEMLNAGLVPLIVMDKHKADFWKQIFPKVTVHEEIALHRSDFAQRLFERQQLVITLTEQLFRRAVASVEIPLAGHHSR